MVHTDTVRAKGVQPPPQHAEARIRETRNMEAEFKIKHHCDTCFSPLTKWN